MRNIFKKMFLLENEPKKKPRCTGCQILEYDGYENIEPIIAANVGYMERIGKSYDEIQKYILENQKPKEWSYAQVEAVKDFNFIYELEVKIPKMIQFEKNTGLQNKENFNFKEHIKFLQFKKDRKQWVKFYDELKEENISTDIYTQYEDLFSGVYESAKKTLNKYGIQEEEAFDYFDKIHKK